MADRDDQLLSVERAAEAIGVSAKRLMAWMVDNEWLVMGDTSYDVIWDQVDVSGNLAVKNGVKVTPKGMLYLRGVFGSRAESPRVIGCDSEVPF